ncbi:multidrug effflux MFS transporter [Leucobacter sp. HY1910]
MKSPSQRLTRGLLVTLGFLSAVGPFAVDLYLPAFTDIADELGTTPSGVQFTLTAFMLGLGLGQLYLGPLSDRLGRRSVLLVALGAFTAASIAMVFSPTVEIFTALRLLQGLAGASGVVLARAIIADLAKGTAAIRAFSLMAMIVAVAPLVAPLAGGFLTEHFGWRGVLATLASVTALMFVLALLLVPETLPVSQRQIGGARRAFGNFARLGRDRAFVLFTLVVACNFAALLSYIAGAPFVGQVMLGMTPSQFSFAFATGALAMVLTNYLNSRLAGRVPATLMLSIGSGAVVLAGTAFAVLSLTGSLSIPGYIACAFVLSGGVALTSSNGTALALGLADFARGSGSALLGAIQFMGGAIAPPIVGAWGDQTALPMALMIIAGSVASGACAVAGAVILRRRARSS